MSRRIVLAMLALVLLVASCSNPNDWSGKSCTWGNGSAGPQNFGCPPGGTALYACNLDGKYASPLVAGATNPPGSCGVQLCAAAMPFAREQAATIAGIDATDPTLVCIALGTTAAEFAQAEVDFMGWPSCVGAAGGCPDPCSDGEGDALADVGEPCTGDDVSPSSTFNNCCHGLVCAGKSASVMGTCKGVKPKCGNVGGTDAGKCLPMWQGMASMFSANPPWCFTPAGPSPLPCCPPGVCHPSSPNAPASDYGICCIDPNTDKGVCTDHGNCCVGNCYMASGLPVSPGGSGTCRCFPTGGKCVSDHDCCDFYNGAECVNQQPTGPSGAVRGVCQIVN